MRRRRFLSIRREGYRRASSVQQAYTSYCWEAAEKPSVEYRVVECSRLPPRSSATHQIRVAMRGQGQMQWSAIGITASLCSLVLFGCAHGGTLLSELLCWQSIAFILVVGQSLATAWVNHVVSRNIRTRNFNRLAPASHRKALTYCYCEIRKRLALLASALMIYFLRRKRCTVMVMNFLRAVKPVRLHFVRWSRRKTLRSIS
jgi:hypothetical protein